MARKTVFGYVENGKSRMGLEHLHMTKAERERYFSKYKKQKGRKLI